MRWIAQKNKTTKN